MSGDEPETHAGPRANNKLSVSKQGTAWMQGSELRCCLRRLQFSHYPLQLDSPYLTKQFDRNLMTLAQVSEARRIVTRLQAGLPDRRVRDLPQL